MTPAAYASRMRSRGQWGGAIEIALTCRLKRVDVHVYEPAAGHDAGGGSSGDLKFRRISVFEADRSSGGCAQQIVSLLYGGRVHYDSLVL